VTTTAITDIRDGLATDLREVPGATVYQGWPALVSVPALIVVPPASGVWLTPGETFAGEYLVSLDVVAISAPPNTPTGALTALEALCEGAISYAQGDWVVSSVDAPGTTLINGIEYLATVVHLRKHFKLD
jgi:hypothetical protein